jgi:hypothetical protein
MTTEHEPRGRTRRWHENKTKAAASHRRAFLRAAPPIALGLGAAIYYASTRSADSNPKDKVVNSFYPEMLDQKVRQNGDFISELHGVSVRWFNFTETNFDGDSANQIFSYFDFIGSQRFELELETPDAKLSFHIEPNPAPRRSALFVVPSDSPIPFWLPQRASGVTLQRTEDNLNLVQIRVPDERDVIFSGWTPLAHMNLFLNIEACQNTVNAISQSPGSSQHAQEIFCNSVGTALTFKQLGAPYEEYYKAIMEGKFTLPTGEISLMTLSEDNYNQIPTLSEVFTIKR